MVVLDPMAPLDPDPVIEVAAVRVPVPERALPADTVGVPSVALAGIAVALTTAPA